MQAAEESSASPRPSLKRKNISNEPPETKQAGHLSAMSGTQVHKHIFPGVVERILRRETPTLVLMAASRVPDNRTCRRAPVAPRSSGGQFRATLLPAVAESGLVL
jgi:hypothetical protein